LHTSKQQGGENEVFEDFAQAVLDLVKVIAYTGIIASVVLGVAWIVKAKISD